MRYVWLLHCTWAVNSAAHLWGERPYDPNSNPAENWVVTILAIGEGWHNWHHKYPFDYAASEYGVTSQFNPTKLVIDTAAMFGLVSDRKRATAMWAREKAKRAERAEGEAEHGTIHYGVGWLQIPSTNRNIEKPIYTGFGLIYPHHAIPREGTPRTRGRTGHRPPPSRYNGAHCALCYREGFSRIGRCSREQRVP